MGNQAAVCGLQSRGISKSVSGETTIYGLVYKGKSIDIEFKHPTGSKDLKKNLVVCMEGEKYDIEPI